MRTQLSKTPQLLCDKLLRMKGDHHYQIADAGTDKPIGIIEPKQNEAMPVGEGSKAK